MANQDAKYMHAFEALAEKSGFASDTFSDEFDQVAIHAFITSDGVRCAAIDDEIIDTFDDYKVKDGTIEDLVYPIIDYLVEAGFMAPLTNDDLCAYVLTPAGKRFVDGVYVLNGMDTIARNMEGRT